MFRCVPYLYILRDFRWINFGCLLVFLLQQHWNRLWNICENCTNLAWVCIHRYILLRYPPPLLCERMCWYVRLNEPNVSCSPFLFLCLFIVYFSVSFSHSIACRCEKCRTSIPPIYTLHIYMHMHDSPTKHYRERARFAFICTEKHTHDTTCKQKQMFNEEIGCTSWVVQFAF